MFIVNNRDFDAVMRFSSLSHRSIHSFIHTFKHTDGQRAGARNDPLVEEPFIQLISSFPLAFGSLFKRNEMKNHQMHRSK